MKLLLQIIKKYSEQLVEESLIKTRGFYERISRENVNVFFSKEILEKCLEKHLNFFNSKTFSDFRYQVRHFCIRCGLLAIYLYAMVKHYFRLIRIKPNEDERLLTVSYAYQEENI